MLPPKQSRVLDYFLFGILYVCLWGKRGILPRVSRFSVDLHNNYYGVVQYSQIHIHIHVLFTTVGREGENIQFYWYVQVVILKVNHYNIRLYIYKCMNRYTN